MRIKTKLILGFMVILIMTISIAYIGIQKLSNLHGNMEVIVEEDYKKVALVTAIRLEVNNVAKGMRNLMLASTNDEKDREIEEVKIAQLNTENHVQRLGNLSTDEEAYKLFTTMRNSLKQYMDLIDEEIELILADNVEEATRLAMNEGKLTQSKFFASIDKLIVYYENQMDQQIEDASSSYNYTLSLLIILSILGIILGMVTTFWVTNDITRGLKRMADGMKKFSDGTDRSIRLPIKTEDEIGGVAAAFNTMAQSLEDQAATAAEIQKENQKQAWLKTNITDIATTLQSSQNLESFSQSLLTKLIPVMGGSHGLYYIAEGKGEEQEYKLFGTYAYAERKKISNRIRKGEGLIGQSALEMKPILLTQVPEDYIKITSGLGEATPLNIIVYPVIFEGKVLGVIEIASFETFTPIQRSLLHELSNNLGIIQDNIFGQIQTEKLLKESQSLTEELQTQSEELITQQDELKRTNEELEEQTEALRNSEDRLQRQQEELEQSNLELENKAKELQEQNKRFELKNQEVERAKMTLEEKAQQLALTSKYKSEFLANMSHELRTPLNSLLILSKLLMENKEGNLTDKQVEFTNTIYSSGCDLLALIDEILDLSKVEAGKVEVHPTHISLTDVQKFVEETFLPVAEQKGLQLDVNVKDKTLNSVHTDEKRLQQILKNLLSNAIKFTNQGQVSLVIESIEKDHDYLDHPLLQKSDGIVAFSIIDTGIGIPKDKQQMIFEAFHQGDGTTSRKFGGTGLGLSISREFAHLLGGVIKVESTVGVGSTFTLYLPASFQGISNVEVEEGVKHNEINIQDKPTISLEKPVEIPHNIEDDRETIGPDDKVLLIVEDDLQFAKILSDMSRQKGFKVILALQGDIGLDLAIKFRPHAILLDIRLPIMDGWTVLKKLKANEETYKIPVHVISIEENIGKSIQLGAVDYLKKPVTKEELEHVFTTFDLESTTDTKQLLIVEDHAAQLNSMIELLERNNLIITPVSTGKEALEQLRDKHFDGMVLDLGLSDISGFDLLETIKQDPIYNDLPILIYTGKDLSKKEERKLKKYAKTIIIKDMKSPERLLEEVEIFLYHVDSVLQIKCKEEGQTLRNQSETSLKNKKILVVDDDIRNVFAISSILESYDMQVIFAENGQEGVDTLHQHPDIDLVLMDIMMPEMDGYEAMREIRKVEKFKTLPIIAVTAKAMKDDRQKCIEAGASDYIAKPIDTDQLLSLLRVWLYK